jgi:SAM-dependent methyltransferase
MRTATGRSDCGVCGGPVTIPFLDGVRDYEFGGIEWSGSIRRCETCGLLQQAPMLSEAEALALYPDTYTHYNFTPSGLRTTLMRLYFGSLTDLIGRLGGKPGDSLLDIGCGAGEKAAFLRDRLGLDVTGIEPNALAAGRARDLFGVNAIHGLFPTPQLAKGSFDFVYINHVIEHVPEPVALLNGIAEVLKPGGWVIGETENVTAPSARLFGRYWSLLHIPFHLYFFSPATLQGTFKASRFGGAALQMMWDPSVVVLSLRNLLRRHKRADEIAPRRVPGHMLLMMATAPFAWLERRNGPIIRFWARNGAGASV